MGIDWGKLGQGLADKELGGGGSGSGSGGGTQPKKQEPVYNAQTTIVPPTMPQWLKDMISSHEQREAPKLQGNIDAWRELAYKDQFIDGKVGWWKPMNTIPGPNGDKLPEGAYGWDNYGNPYFGDGTEGWWKEFQSKYLSEPKDDPDKETIAMTPVGKILDAILGVIPGHEDIKERPALGGTLENVMEGEQGSFLSWATRIPAGVIAAGMAGFNEISKKQEQLLGVLDPGFGRFADLEDMQEQYPDQKDFIQAVASGKTDAGRISTMDYINSLTLDREEMNQQGLPLVRKGSPLDNKWQAGRILYSQTLDPNIRKEYERRLMAGENPYLLSLELENPIAEGVGQMVFDATNLLGMPAKAGRTSKWLTKAGDEFLASDDVIKAAIKTAKTPLEAINAQIDAVKALGLKYDDLSKSYTLLQSTPGGKQSILMRRAGELMQHVIYNTDDPIEGIRALIAGASDNPDEVMELFSFAKKQDAPDIFFSRAARDMGVALRNMLTDETGKFKPNRFLDEFREVKDKGELADVLHFANRKLEDATKNLFPSVLEREKALKLMKEEGQLIPETLRMAARQGENFRVSPAVRHLARMDKAAQSVVGPLNRFFSAVYMGLSPAYAMRNVMSNTMHTAVDMGMGALKPWSINHLQKDISTMSDGTIPLAGQSGFGQRAAVTGLEIAQNYKSAWDAIKSAGMRGLSEYFEEWSGLMVVDKAYRDTMEKMMRVAGKDFQLPPGANPAVFDDAIERLMRNNFDLDQTASELFAKSSAEDIPGKVDAFLDGSWLDRRTVGHLAETKLFNPVMEVIRNPNMSKTEKQDAVWSLLEDVRKAAQRANDETPRIAEEVLNDPINTPAFEAIEEAAGSISEKDAEAMQHYINANSQANKLYVTAIRNTILEVKERVKGTDLEKPVALIERAVSDIALGFTSDKFRDYQATLRNIAVKAKNASYDDETFNLSSWVKKFKDDFGFEFDEMPSSPSQFRSKVWEQFYFPNVRKSWQTFRDTNAQEIEDIFARLYTMLPDINTNEINVARNFIPNARMWDNWLYEDDFERAISAAVKRGNNGTAARVFARQFGIESATPSGVPLDKKLLRIINNNTPKGENRLNLGPGYRGLSKESLVEEVGKLQSYSVSEKAKFDSAVENIKRIQGELDDLQKQYDFLGRPRTNAAKDLQKRIDVLKEELSSQEFIRSSADFKKPLETIGKINLAMDEAPIVTYNTLDEVPVDVSRRALLNHMMKDIQKPEDIESLQLIDTESKFRIAKDMVESEAMSAWRSVPIMEMSTRVREAYIEVLEGLGSEMRYAIPGKRTATSSWESTFPEWYKNLALRSKSKKRIVDGLDALLAGGGENTKVGASLKNIALGHMLDKEANPLIMMDMGFERAAKEAMEYQQELGYDVFKYARNNADRERIFNLLGREEEELIYGFPVDEILKYTEIGKRGAIPRPNTVHGDGPPTFERVQQESFPAVEELLTKIVNGIEENWGKTRDILQPGPDTEAVKDWLGMMKGRKKQAQLVSAGVANSARDFTLLNYNDKRYFDLALAYVFPYQYWYSRTYTNWMKRLASDPGVVAAYAKYKDMLAKEHAGAPDWWKYQVNTNELFGLDSKNPLYFNLDATLNPMYGLTGTDFNDPDKRVNWWASTIDDLGKMGPSPWTPIQWAVAAALATQGEYDAMARWAGRALPQSQVIKSATSELAKLSNKAFGTDFMEKGYEIDPAVLITDMIGSGKWKGFESTDPYEKRRIGRSAGDLIMYGAPEADVIDNIMAGEGPYWDMAAEKAMGSRSLGNISSFMLGVGFRGRNETDKQIDDYDMQRRRISALKDTTSPEELRSMYEELNKLYPFGEAVSLSRTRGEARDEAYSYSILGRIPPGQKDNIAKAVGLDPEMISKFYNDKGDMSSWNKLDRDDFMNKIAVLGGILDLPNDATKEEWERARFSYNAIQDEAAKVFGEDIWTKIDHYYNLPPDKKIEYLEAHPEVDQAQDWRTSIYMSDPTLSKYYGGIDRINKYYKSVMYDELRKEVGSDIWDKWDRYFELQLIGSKEANAYKDAHPELAKYSQLKEQYEKMIGEIIVDAGNALAAPVYPNLRLPSGGYSTNQQRAVDAIKAGTGWKPYTWDDFRQGMSQTLQRVTMDYLLGRAELGYAAGQQLDRLAQDFGLETNVMLELMERSVSP